jgi:hypothetical protein
MNNGVKKYIYQILVICLLFIFIFIKEHKKWYQSTFLGIFLGQGEEYFFLFLDFLVIFFSSNLLTRS